LTNPSVLYRYVSESTMRLLRWRLTHHLDNTQTGVFREASRLGKEQVQGRNRHCHYALRRERVPYAQGPRPTELSDLRLRGWLRSPGSGLRQRKRRDKMTKEFNQPVSFKLAYDCVRVNDAPTEPANATRPWPGLSAKIPQYPVGMRMLPPTSKPTPSAAPSAARSAHSPPDEPPAV
jgi:hypothetical protein